MKNNGSINMISCFIFNESLIPTFDKKMHLKDQVCVTKSKILL